MFEKIDLKKNCTTEIESSALITTPYSRWRSSFANFLLKFNGISVYPDIILCFENMNLGQNRSYMHLNVYFKNSQSCKRQQNCDGD